MAITDLADASYFFALGAKVQARKPGRQGPFDLVDPRAQRGRRGPIQAPRCVKSIRLFFLGRPNNQKSSIFGWRYVCTREDEFFETEMAENALIEEGSRSVICCRTLRPSELLRMCYAYLQQATPTALACTYALMISI